MQRTTQDQFVRPAAQQLASGGDLENEAAKDFRAVLILFVLADLFLERIRDAGGIRLLERRTQIDGIFAGEVREFLVAQRAALPGFFERLDLDYVAVRSGEGQHDFFGLRLFLLRRRRDVQTAIGL